MSARFSVHFCRLILIVSDVLTRGRSLALVRLLWPVLCVVILLKLFVRRSCCFKIDALLILALNNFVIFIFIDAYWCCADFQDPSAVIVLLHSDLVIVDLLSPGSVVSAQEYLLRTSLRLRTFYWSRLEIEDLETKF